MNTTMFLGPSSHKGMGLVFVKNATSSRFVAACAIAGIACFILVGWLAVLVFAGVFAGAAVTIVARKHIGGVSGDVFGAANEVGRLLTLTLWVGIA